MSTVQPSSTRGLSSVAGAVLAGGISAAICAAALMHAGSGLVFLAYITAIPLFMAGLGGGKLPGVIGAITGMIALVVVYPPSLIPYASIFAIPAMGLLTLALRRRNGSNKQLVWYPEGDLLTGMTIYPCLAFLAAIGVAMAQHVDLFTVTQQTLGQIADQMAKQSSSGEQAALLHTLLARLAKFIPSIIAYAWIFTMLISMIIAQNILVQQKWNLRPDFTLNDLHIPSWVVYAVAITGLAGAFAPVPFDYVGSNLAIILGLPFFFVGLAVVHAYAATFKKPRMGTAFLITFYIILAIPFFTWLVLPVTVLGAVDQWVNFRQRFAAGSKQA